MFAGLSQPHQKPRRPAREVLHDFARALARQMVREDYVAEQAGERGTTCESHIYARFSSDLQDVRSIADQVAVASDHATRQGWQVVREFCDAAISGSSLHNRPGLLDLLVAAEAHEFDAVLTESIDRLSRNLENIAGLHKRLAYWGDRDARRWEVGKLHVGLKGIIASTT